MARQQLATGSIVTTLCHDSVKLDRESARRLLLLLDGTRVHGALAAALGTALEGGDPAAREAASMPTSGISPGSRCSSPDT